jgi:hypothetical protein
MGCQRWRRRSGQGVCAVGPAIARPRRAGHVWRSGRLPGGPGYRHVPHPLANVEKEVG